MHDTWYAIPIERVVWPPLRGLDPQVEDPCSRSSPDSCSLCCVSCVWMCFLWWGNYIISGLWATLSDEFVYVSVFHSQFGATTSAVDPSLQACVLSITWWCFIVTCVCEFDLLGIACNWKQQVEYWRVNLAPTEAIRRGLSIASHLLCLGSLCIYFQNSL